jgi:hypothetical protein
LYEGHGKFSKSRNARQLYLPVWTGDEMDKFCDEFEVHREKFSAMDIPDRETVVANFKVLGGTDCSEDRGQEETIRDSCYEYFFY